MTCNRNCDCVGECKAGNDKPATPTPGDLSARHAATLQTMIHQSDDGAICICAECRALKAAIAALSALPAAGGGDVLDAVMNEALRNGTGIMRIDPASIYTTPQPSAAEGAVPFSAKWLDDNGQEATMEWRAGWDACRVEYPRTAPPAKAIPSEDFLPMPACLRRDVDDYGTPDAAVGAQGEDDDDSLGQMLDYVDACAEKLANKGCPIMGRALKTIARRLATPAAGKGVDFDAWHDAKWPEPEQYGHKIVWRQRKADRRAAWQAALTRQPVAGDGMVLVPREPTEAMLAAAPPIKNACCPSAWETYAAMLAAAPQPRRLMAGRGSREFPRVPGEPHDRQRG